ncbi:MAG: helicase-exonuclease AddAB subunit AddA [Firmicutes bacterium]|nr:helicase-exonuclease AddAB subunit AddA [Bacillota bacterium]
MQWSEKQKEAIQDRGHNLLVSAAAGSGKTAVLVERIKGLLLEDKVQLNQMLIVTFSNAAAAEMREKIANALQAEMEREDCDQEKRRYLRGQLNSMHKANISTFHAFAMEVIRRYFYLIDVEPSFRICDEAQKTILQDQAMEQLFQEEFDEKRPEFIRFLDWYATGKSEQDVKDMIAYVHNFIQSIPEPFQWLKRAAQDLAMDEEAFRSTPAWNYRKAQKERLLQLALKYFQRVYDRLEEEGIATLLPKAKADLDGVEARLAADVKFSVFAAGKADKEAYAAVKEEIGALRNRGKELWNQAWTVYGDQDLSQQVQIMNATAWAGEELYRLTEKFDRLYRERKREKNLLDFSDIEHYALQILRNPEAAEEYRRSFACIFIDEYQDSNVIQEELIRCIARENNVFMVGDVKQSIYKFRLAEPEIFLNKYERYRQSEAEGKKIDLNLNFRCKGNIIKTTNQIFEEIMTRESTGITYDEDAALYRGLSYEGELDYPTLLHIVDVKSGAEDADPRIAELASAEVEALQAARMVKEALGKPIYDCKKEQIRPLRKRDVVILLRGIKNYGDLYAKALMEQGIESFMDNSDGYFDTLEIQIFLNLLRIVDNKRQDVALLSVLRSPIFGLSIGQLAQIRAEQKEGSFYDALEAMARRSETEEAITPLARQCAAVLERLALWQEKASFLPLAEFLQMLIEETGYGTYVGAIAGGTQRLANVNAMVDKAIQYEASSGKGLFGFIRYIEAMQRGKVKTGQVKMIGENDDVVRIMTIHKSKGLEFPFVLIGGLGRSFNRRKETAKVSCHKDLGLGLRYVMTKEHAYQKTMVKQLIDENLVQDDMAEEIRILYVGFTRAQDRLMLLAGVKNGDRFREQKSLRLPEDGMGAGCYLDLIFPWTGGEAMEIRYSDRSLLSAQQQEDDLRCSETEMYVEGGFADSGCDDEVRKEIDRRLSFVYEDSGRNGLKTKYTVSELAARQREAAAQSDGAEAEERGRSLKETAAPDWREAFAARPAFLEAKQLTAADRGTIYHRVMECIPFDRQWTVAQVRDFLKDMVKRELITAEEARLVVPGRISGFFRSPLGKRIVAAKKVQKEVSFNLKMEEDGQIITVQGTIDCYFPEEDGIVLVDYKSNFVDNRREEEDVQRLVRWYEPQLQMYRKALETISGCHVKQMYLYLFSAGKAMELPVSGKERSQNGTAEE